MNRDERPVTGTVGEIVVMILGAAAVIAIVGGVALFFAAIGDLIH